MGDRGRLWEIVGDCGRSWEIVGTGRGELPAESWEDWGAFLPPAWPLRGRPPGSWLYKHFPRPGPVLSAGYTLSHLIFTISLLGGDFSLHFTGEETEAQGG